MKNGEGKFGTWTHHKPEKHPVDYPVQDLGMDKDIAYSLKHMSAQEDKYGTWVPKYEIKL